MKSYGAMCQSCIDQLLGSFESVAAARNAVVKVCVYASSPTSLTTSSRLFSKSDQSFRSGILLPESNSLKTLASLVSTMECCPLSEQSNDFDTLNSCGSSLLFSDSELDVLRSGDMEL